MRSLAPRSLVREPVSAAETATADAYIDYNNAVFRLKRLIGDTDGISNRTAIDLPVQTVGPTFGQ